MTTKSPRQSSALPDEVSAGIAKLLSPQALKVTSGKRTLCEIWLRRAVPIKADFALDATELYPFDVGQVVGIVRFPRKTNDFRNQEIGAGVYTLRYGLQPVDGDHVGTSETRDFLLLSPAGEDQDPAKLEVEDLYKFSRNASETTHPAILPMQAVATDFDDATAPAMVHDDAHELWSVVIKSTISSGDQDDEKRVVCCSLSSPAMLPSERGASVLLAPATGCNHAADTSSLGTVAGIDLRRYRRRSSVDRRRQLTDGDSPTIGKVRA